MSFVPPRLAWVLGRLSSARFEAAEDSVVISGDSYLAALKLPLVFGLLLGFAALELVLLWRGKRRVAEARALVPARPAAAVRGAPRTGIEG